MSNRLEVLAQGFDLVKFYALDIAYRQISQTVNGPFYMFYGVAYNFRQNGAVYNANAGLRRIILDAVLGTRKGVGL